MILFAEKLKRYYPIVMWAYIVALLMIRYAEPIQDGDVLWHIKYGEYHIQNRTIHIDHSVYSWTPASSSAPYCTWIADIMLYLLYQVGGFPLMHLLKYVFLFFPVLMAGLYARKTGCANQVLTFLVLIILQLAVGGAAFIKPEVLSLVFFTLISLLYFKLKADRSSKNNGWLFICYPLIFILWANMHGVFFIGLALLASIIVGEVANYLNKSKYSFPRKTLFILMLSGVLSVGSTFLTPYGADLIRNLINLTRTGLADNVTNNILAYQPVIKNLWIAGVEHRMQFWGIMVVSFLMLFIPNVKKSHKIDFGILLPTLFLSWINLKYIRASFYWPPFWAMSIFFLSGKENLNLKIGIQNAKPMIKASLVALMVSLSLFFPIRSVYNHIVWPSLWSYTGFGMSYSLPFQESEYLKNNAIGNKLFNSLNAGSYLLFDLFPGRKVFIDNRSFPYRGTIWGKYFDFRNEEISMEEMESQFGFDTAVITHHEAVLKQFLVSNKWRAVFYGVGGVILVNDSVKFDTDIRNLDMHRFDGLKNLEQAAQIVLTAQYLNDLDTADYIIDIMENNLSYQGNYDRYIRYCTQSQKGLRAFEQGDYDMAFEYLRKVGFHDRTLRVNEVLKTVANKRINLLVNAERYQDALTIIAGLLSYYKNDADVLYNAGVIAYMSTRQAENKGMTVKLPSWRETFQRLLVLKPDYIYAGIAQKLLENENFATDLPLALEKHSEIH